MQRRLTDSIENITHIDYDGIVTHCGIAWLATPRDRHHITIAPEAVATCIVCVGLDGSDSRSVWPL